ncbi:RNA polymerase factor sigma-54 [Cucumibacter marinus]|uniref:RNA polymerase factor sigma-54 n=1 Tax=Cucumibacter marinus TaxID=1121252 RepID=UPI00041A3DF7|nr:RNA polymerase factor sigma-54 [Cucumibacter marinus]
MALSPRLDLRQSQTLTLTPQLMQSIKLLQLSQLELNAFVDAELERNPLLERDEREAAEAISVEAPRQPERGEIGRAGDIADVLDTEVSNLFPEQVGQDSFRQSLNRLREPAGSYDGESPEIDSYVASRPSLGDYLADQIALILRTESDRQIGRALIDSLDDDGYLRADLGALATQLKVDLEDIEAVLGAVQGCEPLGVFARTLPECLTIQLRERDHLDPMMAGLIDNLDLLARHDIAGLKKLLGADDDDIADMLGEIRALDPRPGLAYDGAPVDVVVPDVFIRPGRDGGWQVELNAEVLPRLIVDRTYYAEVSRHAREGADKQFLTDCLSTASWLTKSLDQRAQTILKVTAEIAKQQDGFMRHGVTHLRPMTLKMVADAVEVHESTVSRVTSNKYVATPRGLFELKYFFTTALGSASGGDDHSAEAVRHSIRQLIEAEDPRKILSDDAIAEILQSKQGIAVARRTVAKYREAMGFGSSVQRRREKRSRAAG